MAVKKKNPRKDENVSLTEVDICFIQNNKDLSIDQLSEKLGKSVEIITSYVKDYLEREQRNEVRNLFNKSAKGTISMTMESSMAGGSENTKFRATKESLQQAIEDEDFDRAKAIKAALDKRQKELADQRNQKIKDFVHIVED